MESQKNQKAVLRKKIKAGGITFPDLRLSFKAAVVKTFWYWHKTRQQISGTEQSPEINLSAFLWSVDKGGKNTQWRKDSLFKQGFWESCTPTCESVKSEPFFTPCTRIISKWLKGLNTGYETIKLLEENIDKTFSDVNHSSVFLGQSLKAK